MATSASGATTCGFSSRLPRIRPHRAWRRSLVRRPREQRRETSTSSCGAAWRGLACLRMRVSNWPGRVLLGRHMKLRVSDGRMWRKPRIVPMPVVAMREMRRMRLGGRPVRVQATILPEASGEYSPQRVVLASQLSVSGILGLCIEVDLGRRWAGKTPSRAARCLEQ